MVSLDDGRRRRRTGSVDMGEVTFGRDARRGTRRRQRRQPHVVVRDDPIGTRRPRGDGGPLASSSGGANVEFVTVARCRTASRIRVIERGVGWTLACGTGSVATAAVLHREGLVGGQVTVENPGGDLRGRLGDEERRPAGPVQFVGERGVARSVTYIPTTLIDRTFREKIVLVGVQFPDVPRSSSNDSWTNWRYSSTPPAPTWWRASSSAVTHPTPPRSSVRERSTNCARSAWRSTRTPWSSSTISRRLNNATSRRFSGAPPSTAPR